MSAEVVILVDSGAAGEISADQPGLAMLVCGPGKKVLFDAAVDGKTLLEGAQRLGQALETVDAVVLSHGHCDHTGGLEAMARLRPGLVVYAHPGIFARRWADHPGSPLKDLSCKTSVQRLYDCGAAFQPVRAPEMMEDWLLLSGPVGGPKWGREVFVVRKGDEMVVDGFEDEMFALIRGRDGWAIITGCCHRGLRNILRAARFLNHQQPITAVIGGLHLRSAEEAELQDALAALADAGNPLLYPCHCTGQHAIEFLQQSMPGRVHPAKAGMRLLL